MFIFILYGSFQIYIKYFSTRIGGYSATQDFFFFTSCKVGVVVYRSSSIFLAKMAKYLNLIMPRKWSTRNRWNGLPSCLPARSVPANSGYAATLCGRIALRGANNSPGKRRRHHPPRPTPPWGGIAHRVARQPSRLALARPYDNAMPRFMPLLLAGARHAHGREKRTATIDEPR